MATLTITEFLPESQYWGRIEGIDSGDPALITTRTASTFAFLVASAGNFANWTVTVTGVGFKYLLNDATGIVEPTGGLISSVVLKDDLGNTAMTIDSFPAAQRMELVELYFSMFDTASQVGPNLWDFFNQVLNFNDTIIGTNRNDDIATGRNAGNDTIFAAGGYDWIKGDAGSDTIDGGSEDDTLTYEESFWDSSAYKGIGLNVTAGIVKDSWGGTDTISNIERFVGSRFRDVMIGSDAPRERFMGLRGADVIDGGGVNVVGGNGGRDWAQYQDDARYDGTRGIIANLETSFVSGVVEGAIRDGFGQIDIVRNIERVAGTDFNDKFTGSFLNNVFEGFNGRDTYNGMAGDDRVDFYNIERHGATHGVTVNLALASGQVRNDGFDNIETATSIESVGGSSFNDTIRGNAADNYFEGYLGADTLQGNAGADGFGYYGIGDFGDTILDFTTGIDKIYCGIGVIDGLDGTLRFDAGAAPTQAGASFYFNAADRTLYYDRDGTGTGFGGIAVLTV